MYLPDDAKRIIDLLSKSSYKAYAVGGCVRDALMGREVSDYDITTSALPQQVEAVLDENGIKYFETGIKHGTVTAVINRNPFEITTFRTEGEYLDSRHPESVEFVLDIKEDLSRRDFTVNAIAYNDCEGYIDLFGGINDIKSRIIKTVGNADERFNEDALRIMRALRFASQLGFEIENETSASVIRNKELLNNIAVERIYTELVKLIMGDNCVKILDEYREVISVIIPDFSANDLSAIALAPKKDYIRLAVLLKDNNAEKALKRFKVSNEVYNKTTKLIEYANTEISDKTAVKMLLNDMGEDLFYDLLDYRSALQIDVLNIEEIRQNANDIINNKEPYKISDLDINGFDLISLGFEGKEISEMLEKLLNEVINNPDKNKKDILISIAEGSLSRKNPRLKNYDYSKNGAYFITICTAKKKCFLSRIKVGAIHESPAIVILNKYGEIVKSIIVSLEDRFDIRIPKYVIMPNHIHLLVVIENRAIRESPLQSKRSTLSNVIGYLKMSASKEIHKLNSDIEIWQRGYYDHVIRNEEDYLNHLQYIDENPKKWLLGEDEYYS